MMNSHGYILFCRFTNFIKLGTICTSKGLKRPLHCCYLNIANIWLEAIVLCLVRANETYVVVLMLQTSVRREDMELDIV